MRDCQYGMLDASQLAEAIYMQWNLSVRSLNRQNGEAWVRVLFGVFCIGIIITKIKMEGEFNFVSLSVLFLAAICFFPRVFSKLFGNVRRLKVGSVDIDLHNPMIDHIEEKLKEVDESSALEPRSSTIATPHDVDISDVVRTRQIVLHDDNRERARLSVSNNGSVRLELFDSSGGRRVGIGVSSDGSSMIKLSDNNDVDRLVLRGYDLPISIRDENDKHRIAFLLEDNKGSIGIMNSDEKLCSLLGTLESGGIVFTNSANDKSASGITSVDGSPGALFLIDRAVGVHTMLNAGDIAPVEIGRADD